MKRFLIPIGLGAAALLLFFKTGRRLQNLTIEPVSARFSFTSLLNLRIIFDFNIINPNSKVVMLQALSFDVLYNGKRLGSVNRSGLTAKLAPNSAITKIKSITGDFSTVSVAAELVAALNSGKYGNVTLDGEINADGFTYPFRETIKVSEA